MDIHHDKGQDEEVKESYNGAEVKKRKKDRRETADNDMDDLENEEDQLVNEIDSFLIDDDDIWLIDYGMCCVNIELWLK